MLEEGHKAPGFTLYNQENQSVSLVDFSGKKVVLYFYPKDNTPGCTKEACNLRDNYSVLRDKGVVVLGVSTDSARSHEKFVRKYDLNFDLLADTEKKVVNQYGAWGEKRMYGRTYAGTLRRTYLINEKGVIDKVYKKVRVSQHAEDIIKDWNL